LEAGAKPVNLDTLLRESDVVTVHVVLTRETRHMFGAPQFAQMKRTAYFINTSRGEAVDEEALCDAIEEGVIAGAALNAFESEPIAPDSRLRSLGDKVILRPHGGTPPASAATVGRSVGPATEWMNADILRALRGEVPTHVFNRDAIPLWLQRFGGKSLL
jgi:D-3-phosphoglycerate dehydrogenase